MITVYAQEDAKIVNLETRHAVETLTKIDIIPADYDINAKATRMDCINLLVKVTSKYALENNNSMEWAKQTVAQYDDANLLDDDATYVVALAWSATFFNGSAEGDKLLINPNKELTWREALVFSLRICDGYMYDENISDEEIIKKAIAWEFIPSYNFVGLDKIVGKDELCVLVNKVLHSPVTIPDTMGDYTKYYIDDYID